MDCDLISDSDKKSQKKYDVPQQVVPSCMDSASRSTSQGVLYTSTSVQDNQVMWCLYDRKHSY